MRRFTWPQLRHLCWGVKWAFKTDSVVLASYSIPLGHLHLYDPTRCSSGRPGCPGQRSFFLRVATDCVFLNLKWHVTMMGQYWRLKWSGKTKFYFQSQSKTDCGGRDVADHSYLHGHSSPRADWQESWQPIYNKQPLQPRQNIHSYSTRFKLRGCCSCWIALRQHIPPICRVFERKTRATLKRLPLLQAVLKSCSQIPVWPCSSADLQQLFFVVSGLLLALELSWGSWVLCVGLETGRDRPTICSIFLGRRFRLNGSFKADTTRSFLY